MRNIYLVGFMGSGKTTTGKIVAQKLNKEFVEMDEIIEKKEGKKIKDIFCCYGEGYFRKLEKELLKEISLKEDLVVSCGGGLICDKENLTILKDSGTVINLVASAEVIYERTKNYPHRPLLKENSLEEIKRLLKKREPFYNQADYSLNTDNLSPQEVAEEIIKVLKR